MERQYSFGSVTRATEADIPRLAQEMRAIDVLELKKLANWEPAQALKLSLDNAIVALCIRDMEGVPVTILGLGRHIEPRFATAWLLSTDRLDQFGLLFLQESRALLDDFTASYDGVANLVYSKNTRTLKWLSWLGFEKVGEIDTPFSDGEMFFEMARFRSNEARSSYPSIVRLWKSKRQRP